MINPFTTKFLKWTLLYLNLDTTVVASRGFKSKINDRMKNSADPDTMACSSLIWICTVYKDIRIGLQGLKGLDPQ